MRFSDYQSSNSMKGLWKRCAAAFAAAVIAFSAVPAEAVFADEIDPEASCSMTAVIPKDLEYYEELKKAGVVMDYYKVAEVKADSAGTSFTLEPVGVFTGIGIPLALTPEEIEQDYGSYAKYSDAVSQKAASILLDSIGVKKDSGEGPGSGSIPAPSGEGEGRVSFDGDLKAAVSGLTPGMYLCITHGGGDSYKRVGDDDVISTVAYYITENSTKKTTETSKETIIETTKERNLKFYLFKPMLITVPYYEVEGEEVDGRRVYYSFISSGDQDWLYDIEFVLKADNGQEIIPDKSEERIPKPGTSVRTGDDADLLPYILALAVSGALLISVIVLRVGRRRKKEDERG